MDNSNNITFLSDKISKLATESGDLKTIETDCEIFPDSNVDYVIRKLVGSNLKKEVTAKRDKDFNPFLPYDKTLFIKDISDTHVIVLNKFNVAKNHLLIITKEFVDQERVIDPTDFEALMLTMAEVNGLAFYNSGKIAGASQKHRHLQVVPLPIAPIGAPIPIDHIVKEHGDEKIKEISALPYKNLAVRIEGEWTAEHANGLYNHYIYMLDQLDLFISDEKVKPYNLLITSEWMMMVPRISESYEGISVNALGMAGTFLTKNDEELQSIKSVGPNKILASI